MKTISREVHVHTGTALNLAGYTNMVSLLLFTRASHMWHLQLWIHYIEKYPCRPGDTQGIKTTFFSHPGQVNFPSGQLIFESHS